MSDTESTTPADVPADDTTELKPPGYSPYKLGFGISFVLVLASIATILAFVTFWADRQVLSTDQWADTSTQLIEKPAVRDALAAYMVDQLFDNVDVEQELRNELPSDLDALASPATSAIHSLALSGAKSALAQPIVQEGWKKANEIAHDQLITLLSGGTANVSTENGTVTINTRAILNDVATQVGLQGDLIAKIPESAGSFEVWHSDNLETAQNAYSAVKDYKWVFVIIAILLYVLAIALAKGRRRRAVAWMGGSFLIVGLLVLIAQSLAKGPTVDALASTSGLTPAVTDIYNVTTEVLRQMATSLAITGFFVLLASFVAGPYKWAVAIREFLAPYFRDYLPATTAFAFLLLLIIVWLAPFGGTRTTVGLTINIVLAIAGYIALARISRREFPDAAPADFGSIGGWTKDKWTVAKDYTRKQTENIELPGRSKDATTVVVPPSEAPTVESKPESDERLSELDRLQSLRERGALTDEEFAAQKRKLLDS
jgi:hypothetical protein